MRKLIFAGIIAVFAMITWTCYLQYDTNKFIEKLSQEPPPKQQVNGTKKDSRQSLVDGEGETTQARQQNTSVFSPKETPQDGAQPNQIGVGTGREVDASDPGQTPSNNEISPELIKVFTEIQPIYKEMEGIVREIVPLDRGIYNAMERQEEILSELKTIVNPDEKWKLSEEFESLIKLEQEIGAKMLKLQDKLIPFETELKRILSEYGFQSQREFETVHIKTYKAWVSE